MKKMIALYTPRLKSNYFFCSILTLVLIVICFASTYHLESERNKIYCQNYVIHFHQKQTKIYTLVNKFFFQQISFQTILNCFVYYKWSQMTLWYRFILLYFTLIQLNPFQWIYQNNMKKILSAIILIYKTSQTFYCHQLPWKPKTYSIC